MQALSYGNLDRLETGSLISRLTNDVAQVQEVVMLLLRVMVRVPLLLVGSLIMAVLTTFAPQGRIAFEDVSFSYSHAGQDTVLRDISFVAEPGETVALLGATGSGKSSRATTRLWGSAG
ncbi:MAG: hypothetical protein M3442_04510 [Chloroflexota bacterium]|nr:hypothetical protein [Chloroflexota bacterium]